MIAAAQRRAIALSVLAALAYYGLVCFITPALPYVPVPTWWRQIWPSGNSAVQSWFGLMDATAAIASAVPVAALLVWFNRGRAATYGLAIGVTVAAYVFLTTIVEYGSTTKILVAGVNQFIWISLALPAVALILIRSRGMTD